MRILVVGSGAREHALVWRLGREAEVLCAPGNPGIGRSADCLPVDAGDPPALLALARRVGAALTVVGPEAPLARGVADLFAGAGLRLFGPTRAAAQLEASKAFAKAFMVRHRIPTARHVLCQSPDEARAAVREPPFGFPMVLKADGLAAGKGVVIACDRAEADQAIESMMVQRVFGDAGARLVLEEHLVGPEVSFFVVADGRRAVPLVAAQDHKRVFDGDEGPNTGGMGAFAPSPLVDADMAARILDEIVDPVLGGMREEGHEFRGFLYAGLMLTAAGPRVIEFNVRLGDPEAQVVLPAITGELAPLLADAASGEARVDAIGSSSMPHVGVVLASAGYPGRVRTGLPIRGLDEAERRADVLVFHAGTALHGRDLVTSGGRVLTVVGRGQDFETAIARAYAAADLIEFDGKHARRDIGRKALVFSGRAGA
jgi:phosphoribosylamine--glycine ligase